MGFIDSNIGFNGLTNNLEWDLTNNSKDSTNLAHWDLTNNTGINNGHSLEYNGI